MSVFKNLGALLLKTNCLKIVNFTLPLLVLVLFSNCRPLLSFQWYDDTIDAEHSTAINVFDNHLWNIGGYNTVSPYGSKKVRKSSNGVNWVEVAELPEERVDSKLEVFNDAMWLTGGLEYYDITLANEILKSPDGINWEAVPLPDGIRYVQSSYVFNDYLYLLASSDGHANVSLYRSLDGNTWERVSDSFPVRYLNIIVELDSKLYAFTNGEFTGDGSVERENEIWTSSNGIDWSQLPLPEVYISTRAHYSVGVHNNKIWLVGGSGRWFVGGTTYEGPEYNDIWAFNEREGWKRYSGRTATSFTKPPFESLVGATAVPFRGKLWLIHGRKEDGSYNTNYSFEEW